MSDDQFAPPGHEPIGEGNPPAAGAARAATATETGEPHAAESGQDSRPEEVSNNQPNQPGFETESPAESDPVAAEAAPPPQAETPISEPPAADTQSQARFEPEANALPPNEPAVVPPAAPATTPEPSRPAKVMDATAEFEAALEAFEGGTTGTVYDDAFRRLTRGELVTARVIQVDTDKVFVDLGTKSEGVVPLEELSSTAFEKPGDVVKVGDEIKVVVLNPEGREGNPIVSRKRAEFESAWDRIVEEFERKDTVTALVTERVKGGLVVDLGVRGFVPATHVGSGQIRNLDKFVGQSMPFKIIEVDRDRRKVVLSNKYAEEETREQRKNDIFDKVKPGDILDGNVRRIVDYGAFVDLGGVDGLLHVSEMSWSRVDHPKEVLREGDDVRVMVLRLDPNNGRISLGRRQVLPDPWSSIRENYQVGQRLTLPVSRVVQSGAFVKLSEGAEAFIPISEMAHRRINKPSEVVEAGQDVEVQVIDLRPDERRMVLSMRALLPYEERPQGGSQRDDIRHRSERSRDRGGRHERQEGGGGGGGGGNRGHQSAPTGNMTIGERLSALKGLTGYDADEQEAGEPADEPPTPDEAAEGTPEESA